MFRRIIHSILLSAVLFTSTSEAQPTARRGPGAAHLHQARPARPRATARRPQPPRSRHHHSTLAPRRTRSSHRILHRISHRILHRTGTRAEAAFHRQISADLELHWGELNYYDDQLSDIDSDLAELSARRHQPFRGSPEQRRREQRFRRSIPGRESELRTRRIELVRELNRLGALIQQLERALPDPHAPES